MALVTGLSLALPGCTRPAAPDNPGGVVIVTSRDPMGFTGGTSLPSPYPLPDAVLTDTTGHDFNLRTSPSARALLLFFGYTNCPDVCPTVLAQVALALSRLDASVRQQLQLIFVTTDPKRDTPTVIGAYLDRFDPTFIGLTGELGEITAVAGKVGVEVSGLKKLPDGGYEVGHGAQVTGFDAARDGVVVWTPSTAIGDLKHDFTVLVGL